METSQIKPSYNSDQDISQIVDQVLSCIDTSQFDLEYNQENADNSTLLLCHNCGARLKTKVSNCRLCGTEMSHFEQTEEQTPSDLKR